MSFITFVCYWVLEPSFLSAKHNDVQVFRMTTYNEGLPGLGLTDLVCFIIRLLSREAGQGSMWVCFISRWAELKEGKQHKATHTRQYPRYNPAQTND